MWRLLSWFNTLAIPLLTVLVAVQWWNNRAEHDAWEDEHRLREACKSELAEKRKRTASLEGDTHRLALGLQDAQKASAEARVASASLSESIAKVTAERDQLKREISGKEQLVKERDAEITQMSGQVRELRERLDEKIQRLKKTGP